MTLSSRLSNLNKSSASYRDRRRSATPTTTKDDCDTVSLTEDELNKSSFDEPRSSDNNNTTIINDRRMVRKLQQEKSYRRRSSHAIMEEGGGYESPFYPSSQDEHDDHHRSRSSRRLRPSTSSRNNDRHGSLSDEELTKRRAERGLRNKSNSNRRRESLVSFRQQSQSASNTIHNIQEEEDDADSSLSHDDEPQHKKPMPQAPASHHHRQAPSQPQRNNDYYDGHNSPGSSLSHDDEPHHEKPMPPPPPPPPTSHHRQLSPPPPHPNDTYYNGNKSSHSSSSSSSHSDEHDDHRLPPTHRPFPQQHHPRPTSRRLSAPHTTSYPPPTTSPRTRRSSMNAALSPNPTRRSSFNPASTTPYTASIPRVPSTDSMASSQSRNSIPYFDDFEIPEGAVMSQEKFGNQPTRLSSGSINCEVEDLMYYEDDIDVVEDIPLGSSHGKSKDLEMAAVKEAMKEEKRRQNKQPAPRRFSMPLAFKPAPVEDISLHSDEDERFVDSGKKKPSPRINKKKIQRRHSMAVDSIIQDDFEDYHQQDLHAEIERKRLRKQQRKEAEELRRQRELEMDIRRKLEMRQQERAQEPQHYGLASQQEPSHLWDSDTSGTSGSQQPLPHQQQPTYRSQRRYSMPVSNLTPVDENHTWDPQPPQPPPQQRPSQRRMTMSALPPVNERHPWDPTPTPAASQWTVKKQPPPENKSLRQSIVESQKGFRESILMDANRRLNLEDIEKEEAEQERARSCEPFEINPSGGSQQVPLVPAFEVNGSRHIYNCRRISYVKVPGGEEEEYGRRGTTISVDASDDVSQLGDPKDIDRPTYKIQQGNRCSLLCLVCFLLPSLLIGGIVYVCLYGFNFGGGGGGGGKSSGSWKALPTLTHSGGSRFGQTISLSHDGTRLAVGAPRGDTADNDGLAKGLVKVYEMDGKGGWIPSGQDLGGDVENGDYGASIAMSGDGSTLAVGAKMVNEKVFVYTHDEGTEAWTESGDPITPLTEEAGDEESKPSQFGTAVSISSNGTVIAITAPLHDYAVVFHSQDSVWTPSEKIKPNSKYDCPNGIGDAISLSSDGSRLVTVGPSSIDCEMRNVEIFDHVSNDPKATFFSMDARDGGSVDPKAQHESVSLSPDGTRLAYIYTDIGVVVYYLNGPVWQKMGEEIPYDDAVSVAIGDDDTVVLGRRGGTVHVVKMENGKGWQSIGGAIEGDGEEFGHCVAFAKSGDDEGGDMVVVVGSPLQGSVWTFQLKR